MKIHAYGGLCNRLRVILSYSAVYSDLTVAWEPNEEVHFERFSDVFKPIDDVTIVDSPGTDWPKTLDPNNMTAWQYRWGFIHLLQPWETPEGSYIAMHVRRTDCIGLQKKDGTYLDEQAFIDWARKYPDDRVYLATDNVDTQRRISEALGSRVMAFDLIEYSDQQRQTSLRHAWADILACSKAKTFMGSGSSSFTTTIETLRRLHA